MERIKLCLPSLIIILLISGLCVWYFQDQDYYDNWRRAKEAIILKQKKDSLRKEIDSLQTLIDLRDKEIDSLKMIYPELENKLIIIKSQKDEKIRAVDSYTLTEFEEFFSNRYPEK